MAEALRMGVTPSNFRDGLFQPLFSDSRHEELLKTTVAQNDSSKSRPTVDPLRHIPLRFVKELRNVDAPALGVVQTADIRP